MPPRQLRLHTLRLSALPFFRSLLVRLSYALMRIAAHHLIHAGEIVTVRSCSGHDTDKFGRPDWGRPLA